MPWEVPITVGGMEYPVKFDGDSEPTQQEIDEAGEFLTRQHGPSIPGAALRSAARGVIPAFVGGRAVGAAGSYLGGVGASALLGAEAGSAVPVWGNIIGGLIGAGVGMWGAGKLQEKAADVIDPSVENPFSTASQQRDYLDQPLASEVGGLAIFKPNPMLLGRALTGALSQEGRNLVAEGFQLTKLGKTADLTAREVQALKAFHDVSNVAGNIGIGAGMGAVQGEDLQSILKSAGIGALFNDAWLHGKPTPIRDLTDEAQAPPPAVQPEGTIPAEATQTPPVAGTAADAFRVANQEARMAEGGLSQLRTPLPQVEELPPPDLSVPEVSKPTFQQVTQIEQQDAVFARKVQDAQRVIQESKQDPTVSEAAREAEISLRQNVATDLVERGNEITDLEIQHQEELSKATEQAAKEQEQLAKQENASTKQSTTMVGEQPIGEEGARQERPAGVEPSEQGVESARAEAPQDTETPLVRTEPLPEASKPVEATTEPPVAAVVPSEVSAPRTVTLSDGRTFSEVNGEWSNVKTKRKITNPKLISQLNEQADRAAKPVETALQPEAPAAPATEAVVAKTVAPEIPAFADALRSHLENTGRKWSEEKIQQAVEWQADNSKPNPSIPTMRVVAEVERSLQSPEEAAKADALAKAEDERVLNEILEDRKRATETTDQSKKPIEDEIDEVLKADEPDEGLRTNLRLDLGLLDMDVYKHGLKTIYDGVTNFSKWGVEMVKQFGQGISKFLSRIWEHLQGMVQAARKTSTLGGEPPKTVDQLTKESAYHKALKGDEGKDDLGHIEKVSKAIGQSTKEFLESIGTRAWKPMTKELASKMETFFNANGGWKIKQPSGRTYRIKGKGPTLSGGNFKQSHKVNGDYIANVIVEKVEDSPPNRDLQSQLTEAKPEDRQRILSDWLSRNPKSAAELQRMVDDAAKAGGYEATPVWRADSDVVGVPNVLDQTYSGAIHTATTHEAASKFLKSWEGKPSGVVRKFYLSAKKTASPKDAGREAGNVSNLTKEEIGKLSDAGFDSVRGPIRDSIGEEVIVFDPSQIKSADPITLDDSGRIIPLEERFKPEGEKANDIRYMDATGLLTAANVLHTMGRQAKDLASFSKSAIQKFGEWVKPHVEAIWNSIKGGAESIHEYLKGVWDAAKKTSQVGAIGSKSTEEFGKPQSTKDDLLPRDAKAEERKVDAGTLSLDEYKKKYGVKSPIPKTETSDDVLSYADKLNEHASGYPRIAAFVELIKRMGHELRGVPITIHETLQRYSDGKRVGGLYDRVSNHIHLGESAFLSPSGAAKALAHESVHAATVRKIDRIEAGEATQKSDIENLNKLKGLFSEAKEAAKGSSHSTHYGLTNFKEFIAEALSNVKFQEFLHSIKKDGKSAWNRLVDIIGKMLHLGEDRSLLTDVLEASDNLISSSVPFESALMAHDPSGRMTSKQRVYGRYATSLEQEYNLNKMRLERGEDDSGDLMLPSELEEERKHIMHGEEVEVLSKPSYTPEEAIEGAAKVLDDLGIKHELVDLPASNREGETVESFHFNPETFTDKDARDLADRMVELKSTGNETELGPLIASITNNLGGHNPELVSKLSENARFRLIQVARSQASAVGRLLGSLGMHSASVNERASDPLVHLINEFHSKMGEGQGEALDAVTRKLGEELPHLLSTEEITQIGDKNADVAHITEKLAEATEPVKLSRIVRWVNSVLSPKKPSSQKFKEEFAMDREAADAIIEHAKALGVEEPEKLKNQKLTPEERLARMTTDENMLKIQTAIENAVAEVQDKIDSGDPKFAHWKQIEDNFLSYSPTTVKLARDVIRGRFKGTKFGGKETKEEDVRIDLRKLATSPKAEVERVIGAQMDALSDVMKDASPDTVAKIREMIEGDIREQLESRRKEYVEQVTKGKDVSYEGKTKEQIEQSKAASAKKAEDEIQKLLNANGLVHKSASEIAGKRVMQKVVPTMRDMIQEVMANPANSQAELPKKFAEALASKFQIDPALADKFGETLARAYGEKFKAARQRALKESVKKLTPRQREAVGPGTPLWKHLNALANSGDALESINVLRAAMKEAGHKMPTYEQTKQLQDLSKREQELRQLTEEDKANGVTAYQKEKATRADRQPLINKMETLWATLTKPVSWTGEGRQHASEAMQEFASANMLTTPSFVTKQLVDVGTQMFYHTWSRALAGALERYKTAKAKGGETEFWKDAATGIGDAYRQRLQSTKAAMADASVALGGKSLRSQVMNIKTGVHAFERLEAQAQKLQSQGRNAEATILRLLGLAKYSFRYASALDHFQGKMAEHQEKRDYIVTKLTADDMPLDQARKKADQIMGDMAKDHEEAMKVVSKMPEVDAKNRNAAAWELVDARQNERMEEAGLSRQDFAEQSDALVQQIGWNLPEEGGLGGVVGGFIKNLDQSMTKAGLPLPVARFGNAVAIGINRALTFSGLGLFPRAFGHTGKIREKESPWFRTAKDRTQRKIEAVSGLAFMGGTMFALAANGLMRVYNEWPKDPEDRELWERDGHRPGTIEFNAGNGKVIRVSMTTGPFSVIRPILSAIGSVQDKEASVAKKNLDAKQRARKGGLVATAKEMDTDDLIAAAMRGGWASIMQGRTTSALLGGKQTMAEPNLSGIASTMTSALIPFQPMGRTLNNLAGNSVDYKKADLLDMLLPSPWSPQKKNFLGDVTGPGSHSDRIISILTGGTVPRAMSPSENDTKPYAILRRTGYRPPSISPDAVYPVSGKLKPLSPQKLDIYTEARGRLFKRALSSLPYSASKEEVSKAYREANAKALRSVGVTP